MSWNERIDPINQNIRAKESLIVALSGGVDSAVVAALAAAALGERALSVTVNSPLTGTTELEDARRSAGAIGINHMVIDLNELEIPGFATNPPERCYLCKRFRYQRLLALADELGYRAVADGTTTGDLEEYRPGRQAADELGAVLPAGLALIHQLEIRLVHKGGRLQSMPGPLTTQIDGGQATKFVINPWQEFVYRVRAAIAYGRQEPRHITWIAVWQGHG